MTHYLGFRVNSGEYKVMGLAAERGSPALSRNCARVIDIRPDGSFSLNMEYFDFDWAMRHDQPALGQTLRRPATVSRRPSWGSAIRTWRDPFK